MAYKNSVRFDGHFTERLRGVWLHTPGASVTRRKVVKAYSDAGIGLKYSEELPLLPGGSRELGSNYADLMPGQLQIKGGCIIGEKC